MSVSVVRAGGSVIAETPIGAIQGYAGTAAPTGWLLCDGTAVSRSTYSELFGVIGTTYGTGDGSTTFNLPDSAGFIIYATRLSTRVTLNNPPEFVTALPSSPLDGKEIYYQADGTNGVIWHLRYRSGSSSSYKWEFVGGGLLTTYSASAVSFNSATPALLATGDKITVPLAGDYVATAGGNIYGATSGYNTAIRIFADTGSGAADTLRVSYTDNGANRAAVVVSARVNGVVANTAIEPRYYRETSGTPSAGDRWHNVVPVRVG